MGRRATESTLPSPAPDTAYLACASKQRTARLAPVNRSNAASTNGGCVKDGLRAGYRSRGGDTEATSHDTGTYEKSAR